MKRPAMIVPILTALLLCALPAASPGAATSRRWPTRRTEATGSMRVLLESPGFTIGRNDGADRIEMEGFGWRGDPGRPLLPSRTHLFLLPPGARAHSVDVTRAAPEAVPGMYRLEPTPPVLPAGSPAGFAYSLSDAMIEWRETRLSAYASDDGYPTRPVEIVSAGTLREYAYVAVTFSPLAYHARSGRLYHYPVVECEIRYSLDDAADVRAGRFRRGIASATAARLFENYHECAPLYEADEGEQGGRDETHDYVIVTTELLQPAVASSQFADWKTALGHDVRVVLLTDPEIAGQPGDDTPAKLRNFLRQYYGPWGIEYVLILGDYAQVPMRYCFPDATNHAHSPGTPWDPGGSVPTDFYYADLSLSDADSWDLDGDGYPGEYLEDAPDFLAEVSVGRIPVSNSFNAAYALTKTIQFEQDTGAWKDRALHGGAVLFYENEDHSGGPYRDGATCLDMIESTIMTGWDVSHYCEREGLDPSDYAWPALRYADFTSDWRLGTYGVVNWAGHGSPDGAWRVIWTWDDGDGVFEKDGSDGVEWEAFIAEWAALSDDHPSIVFAVSCNVGYPESNGGVGRLGVGLLARTDLGAGIGVVSASRVAAVSGDWPAFPGGAESFCYEFNRFMIDGPAGPEKVGDALYDAKFFCFANYGWAHYFEYWNQCDYNLYGDPALHRSGVDATGVEECVVPAPTAKPVLMQNAPNPFGSGTALSYTLPGACHVTLEIYDVAGRRVARLLDEPQPAGTRRVLWDGTDDGGRPVASGVYYCRLSTADGVDRSRMVLLR